MIIRNTVFILGAGASCSYGFPSGRKLMTDVVGAVRNSFDKSDESRSFLLLAKYRVADDEDVISEKCHAFANALSNAGQASIDAFLDANRHKKGFDVIGKGAIAQVLLNYENNISHNTSDDWLSYVFKIMIEGVNSPQKFISNNNVSFITFNYDTILEKILYTKIKNSFGIDDSEASAFLREIPIHHVYGKLNNFPDPEPEHRYPWVIASKGIKTIFETEKDVDILEACKQLLNKAHSICMLGFGFHQENIDLLDLPSCWYRCKQMATASRYDITDNEIQRLMTTRNKAHHISFSQIGDKCLSALRNLSFFETLG